MFAILPLKSLHTSPFPMSRMNEKVCTEHTNVLAPSPNDTHAVWAECHHRCLEVMRAPGVDTVQDRVAWMWYVGQLMVPPLCGH